MNPSSVPATDRSSRRRPIARLLFAFLLTSTAVFAQDYSHRASPFDAVRWEGDRPEVRLENEWYRLLAIDDSGVDEILDVIRSHWGASNLNKRFTEDLMEALALLDAEAGPTVHLRVLRLTDHAELVLRDVANTLERRRALWAMNQARRSGITVDIDRHQAEQDLDSFGKALRSRFAYLTLSGLDLERELEGIRRGLSERPRVEDLARSLHYLLNRFGDGHASVSAQDYQPTQVGPFLPFLMADSSADCVAFWSDRSGFVDEEHPLVRSIDGHSIARCVAAVAPEVVDGSPQSARMGSLRLLRNYGLWRPRLGEGTALPRRIAVELSSIDGERTRTLEMEPAIRKPTYGDWPRTPSRKVGELGYLRIPSMSAGAGPEVHRAMQAFRRTQGLIVDVRGNGGGSREALIALAGYLTDPESGPWVGSVAAFRAAEFPEDHLEERFMYRANWSGWNERQLAAIRELAQRFEPEWTLPEGFSEWHYLVLGPTGQEDEYPYEGKVVVLSDAGCFSATDIFLGALELLPQVTLLGSPSAGGSARVQRFSLPHSSIEVDCASMASFRPNGKLYERRGIEVDVALPPNPESFIAGGVDRVLVTAIERLGGDPANWHEPSDGLPVEGDAQGFVRGVVEALASKEYAKFEAMTVLGMEPEAYQAFVRDAADHPHFTKIARVWDSHRGGYEAKRHEDMLQAYQLMLAAASERGLDFADARVGEVRWRGDGDDMEATVHFGEARLGMYFDDCFATPAGILMFDPPVSR